MRELIIPNIHAAFLHIPIGLLIVGTLIELFACCWRGSGLRAAGRWMILLGALLAVPVATSGMFALSDVIDSGRNLTAEQSELIKRHIVTTSIATLLACLVVVAWIGSSDSWRSKLHWPLLAVLLAAVGFLILGAWNGGEMVYAQAIAVGQKEAVGPIPELTKAMKSSFHPLELHVIGAGFVVALSLGALALSIRGITVANAARNAAEAGAASADGSQGDVGQVSLSDVRAALSADADQRVPSTRFWLLATLAGLAVAAGGLYAADMLSWHEIKEEIEESIRIKAHTILGVGIVVLTLVLAMLSRWGRRSTLMLSIFGSLLVLAVAGQIWIGTLLLYDGDHGTLTKFEMSSDMPAKPTTKPAE